MVLNPNESIPAKVDPAIDRRDYLKLAGTGAGFAIGGVGSSTMATSPVRAASGDDLIIEDFEDNDLDEYDVDRGSNYSIVSAPAYEGFYALELADDSAIELISTSGLGSYPQAGDTFSVRFRTNGTGNGEQANFTYGVQGHTDRYYVMLNPGTQELGLYKYKNGSTTVLGSAVSASFSADTWHVLEIEWETDGTQVATLYNDEAKTQLAQVSGSDTEWTNGGIGFDAYLSTGEAVYFDAASFGAVDFLSEHGQGVVDNFEDGDLSEYRFDRGSSGASVVNSPTYNGSNALAINGTNTEMISTGGLPHYPHAGTAFGCWVRATDGGDDLNVTYGVQDHENRYYVHVDFTDDNFQLFKYDAGSSIVLDEQNSGFALAQGTWYKVKVDWARDGTHTATLFDSSGNRLARVSATDSTWTSGGVGYDAYLGSSGGTVYFDTVTIDNWDDSGIGVIIDSFEDGDLSEYNFDRGQSGATIVSSPTYIGSKALQISGTNTEMYKKGLPNEPRAGDVFSYFVRATDGASDINLTYGVQDHKNRYLVRVDFADGELRLYRYENDTAYLLESTSGVTLSEDAWYKVEVDWRISGQHIVTLSESTEITQITATDATWISGGIGYDAYLADAGTVYFDYITKGRHSTPDVGKVVDDFNDGNLSEYTFDRGSSGARLVSTQTYYGSHALELSGTNTEMISTSGLARYPSSGDQFRCRVRATDGAGQFNFTYGVQDHNNRYFVLVNFATNKIGLYRYENETSYKLAAKSGGFCLAEDTWFRIEVNWTTGGDHTVGIYNDSEELLGRISATDATWSSGGIGFDAYLKDGGTVYVDHVLVDGLARKQRDLYNAHGLVTEMTAEKLSDGGYESRRKVTYTYEDGYSYEKTVADTGDKKRKITDDSAKYWARETAEAISLIKDDLERVKARSQ
jgi:hypothetical protein